MIILTDENLNDYLKNHYDKVIDEKEFEEEKLRFKHIKKLITRYITNGESDLKERLILNHLIILINVFGIEATVRTIFLKMPEQLSYIKPFLILLNVLPKYILNIEKECVLDTDNIIMDMVIIERLRKIVKTSGHS